MKKAKKGKKNVTILYVYIPNIQFSIYPKNTHKNTYTV